MGDTTYTNFQAYLAFALGNRDDLGSYTTVWTNAAYRTLTSKREWKGRYLRFPELETSASTNTVDGTAYISTPTDTLFIHRVFDETSDIKLDKIDFFEEYLAYTDRDDTSAEGAPTEWARSGAYIYLHPTPDAVYAIKTYYRKRPTALSAGGDTTAIGAEWDEPILMLALYQSALKLKEFEAAQFYYKEFSALMDDLVGIYDVEDLDMNSRRRPSIAYLDNEYGK